MSTIRRAREQAGLTQEQLAERLGVSRYTVIKWEAGRVPASRYWPALVELGVSSASLVRLHAHAAGVR